MFLIHAIKAGIHAFVHAMQIVIAAAVLLSVVVFHLDILDDGEEEYDQ